MTAKLLVQRSLPDYPAGQTTAVPKGVTVALATEGGLQITHYTKGMFGLKLFALIWCGVWMGVTCLSILQKWQEQKAVNGMLSALLGLPIALLFILIGFAAVWLLWADQLATRYDAALMGLKLFTLCGGWAQDSCFVLVKMWLDLESVVGFFAALTFIEPLFFLIGSVSTSLFLWQLCKRTTLTLGRRTLQIERRLWSFVRHTEHQKSNITRFKVDQDGGEGEDSFLSFSVDAELTVGIAPLFSRQSNEVAEWMSSTLNTWLRQDGRRRV